MLAELIAVCALTADPGLSVEPLGLARPNGLLRVAVRCAAADGSAAPLQLDAELSDSRRVLSATSVGLLGLPTPERPTVLVLPIVSTGQGHLRVRVTAVWPGGPGLPMRSLTGEAPVIAPATILVAATDSIVRLRASGETDPLPWLWAEEIAELAAGESDAVSAGDVSACAGRLDAWLDGKRPGPLRPGRNDLALRDPVDGSLQPWRLHLPNGAGPFPCALLLSDQVQTGKLRWPDWDGSQIQAALAAGIAVVEAYPAGDRRWQGAARRRLDLILAETQRLCPLDLSQGVVLSATTPTATPYPVHHPSASASNPAWWHSVLAPPLQVAAMEPGWADAPFIVIVGASEHMAAVAANRRLAEAFRAAYAAHAHALVELHDDSLDPELLRGRNLVLIGNPRSNRVLAALGLQLPFTWDHREVRGPDGFDVLRATGPSLACSVRLPDGHVALVLDGSPPPWGDGLPLAGQPDPLALPAR